jgi:hypothetical protein
MAQQIGSKVIVKDGQQVTVRVFAPNVRHEVTGVEQELEQLKRRLCAMTSRSPHHE